MTLTTKELQHIVETDHVLCGDAAAMAKELLAAREAVPDLVLGMDVSIDVSTCDEDAGHRLFGTVTEVSELEGAKNGCILLVQDAEKNFTAPPAPAVPEAFKALVEHLSNTHAFIENTEAFGLPAASGAIQCGDAVWNIDESKEALRACRAAMLENEKKGAGE